MSSKHIKKFKGPLFIIGMPRSGTKLLMRLLSNHTHIKLANETEFLPYYIKRWNQFGNISTPEKFHYFYLNILKTSFLMKKKRKNNLISEKTWHNLCTDYSLPYIYESLIRYYTKSINDKEIIWGDKSPGYTKYVNLIKKEFPTAKFIHIIRDVRDCAISANKAWGNNMIRYAQRWNDSVLKARADLYKYNQDYLEIKYEELLIDPKRVVNKCCSFVNLKFHNNLLILKSPSEYVGDAKGLKEIKKNNIFKYKKEMNPKIMEKIEKIPFIALKSYGYEYDYNGSLLKLSRTKMLFYQILDFLSRTRFDLKTEGLKNISNAIKRNIYHVLKSRFR